MGGQVSLAEYLFSSAGRLGRVAFLLGAAGLLALGLVVRAVVPSDLQWLGWLVDPPLLFCGCCITSKRLHDRGRTGWWAGVILGSLICVWVRPQGFFAFLSILVLVWAAVELGLIAGEPGANRFGPSPARPATA